VTGTIASDEDMDTVFVLVDDDAPTAKAALALLLERAPVEWGYRIAPECVAGVSEPFRHSYKWQKTWPHDEENLVPCQSDDPDRDSDWWVFDTIAPGDWESV
jgi:hypothetical protein